MSSTGGVFHSDYDWSTGEDNGYWEYPSPDHYIHQRKPFNEHYPDKQEAKTLRRIMSQTGLSESEVRSIKKYRIELADASKRNEPKSICEKFRKRIIKQTTKETGLVLEHPKSLQVLKKFVEKYLEKKIWYYWGHSNCAYCKGYFDKILHGSVAQE